jgi:V8-like Glu-specific endopeptidase
MNQTIENTSETAVNIQLTPPSNADWVDVGTVTIQDTKVLVNSSSTGQVQWVNFNAHPGLLQNVSEARIASGILIDRNHFLTASHVFGVKKFKSKDKYYTPVDSVTLKPLNEYQLCKYMQVNFNYQGADDSAIIDEESYPIEELLEYKINGLDYAIARLVGSPGDKYGFATIRLPLVDTQFHTYTFHHPAGLVKKYSESKLERLSFTKASEPQKMKHSMDTVGGSSGAGIFDLTSHHLIAVHTNGDNEDMNRNTGLYTSAIYSVSPKLRELIQSDADLKSKYEKETSEGKKAAALKGALIGAGAGILTVHQAKVVGTSKQLMTIGIFAVAGATVGYIVKEGQLEHSKDDDYFALACIKGF